MSSKIFDKQSTTPTAPRRSPTYVEDTSNVPRRTSSRNSLSDRLKNVFRRGSSSPNRTASNDRRPVSTISTVPQYPSTTASGKSSPDTPQLRAPTISWPFGKKKNKSPTAVPTPKTSKKKTKAPQQPYPNSMSMMEISAPVYSQDNQPAYQRETFPPRTPETMRNTSERYPTLTPDYDRSSPRGFRDYVVIDQSQYSQQVVVSNVDNFTPYPHTSDRSRSPSMNRQRFTNTGIEHSYYHDNSTTATGSIPIADVEVISTPQQKRRAPDMATTNGSRIVTEKPPMASRPGSTTGTNPAPWNSTSSSTLNNPDARSTRSSTMDVSTPRLNAPTVSFGGGSNKKKDKRTKSQTRLDGMSSSSSTISKLAEQNPARPNETWKSTYGSLPDAEIIYGGSSTSLKPSKSKANKYPGISAIVQHHMLRPPVSPLYPNGRIVPTSPISTPGQRQRFDTSTTTLNQYDDNQMWPPPRNNGSSTSPSSKQRQDGYIRPMTPTPPTKSSSQTDVSVIRVDIDDHGGRSPSTRPPRYTTPEPPTMYRSSTTVYTRDKQQYVDGGEIRTWSSQENNSPDDYYRSYRGQPYIHVQVDVKRAHQTDEYEHQYVSSKTDDRFKEYRYSPRAHEEELYVREQKTLPDSEIHEEEKYEVSYEYEQQQNQQYSFENKSHYDQLHSAYRYTTENDDDQNLTYANLAPSSTAARSVAFTEREKVYDQPPRIYSDSEHIQETYHSSAPVHHSEGIPRSYRLRRSDSYDGLGISVSANSQTRSNHYIREVERGSPADRAGLRVNDRIISINGTNVENVDFDDVLILLKQGLDNDNLQLSVLHELDQI